MKFLLRTLDFLIYLNINKYYKSREEGTSRKAEFNFELKIIKMSLSAAQEIKKILWIFSISEKKKGNQRNG